MTQVNDNDNTLIIAPELKAFARKMGVPQGAGNNDGVEFLPFDTDPFALVNE